MHACARRVSKKDIQEDTGSHGIAPGFPSATLSCASSSCLVPAVRILFSVSATLFGTLGSPSAWLQSGAIAQTPACAFWGGEMKSF